MVVHDETQRLPRGIVRRQQQPINRNVFLMGSLLHKDAQPLEWNEDMGAFGERSVGFIR